MKALLVIGCLFLIMLKPSAQVTKASLQASGLTCTMCSKAVKSALEKIRFVEKVEVNINSQEYQINFIRGTKINLDDLNKAVKDAGFSIALLKVTAQFDKIKITKDELVKVGNQNFCFLNGDKVLLNGEKTVTLIDKNFLTTKEYKKYNSIIKQRANLGVRVYHVII